jgi:hypothetical protein
MKLSTLADVRDLVERHFARTVPPQGGLEARLKSASRSGTGREGFARNLRVASPGIGTRGRRMPDEVKPRRFPPHGRSKIITTRVLFPNRRGIRCQT